MKNYKGSPLQGKHIIHNWNSESKTSLTTIFTELLGKLTDIGVMSILLALLLKGVIDN